MIAPLPLHQSLYTAAAKTPMIHSKSDEYALVKRAQAGDSTATSILVLAYMRLIVSLTRRFAPNADPNDLVSEGVMGFMRAIETFDTTQGFRLGTYARMWILDRQKDHTQKVRSLVGISTGSEQRRGMYNLAAAIEAETQQARQRGEYTTHAMLVERAAARIHISPENAFTILARAGGDASLNTLVGTDRADEKLQWQDTLVDERANPEDQLQQHMAVRTQNALISQSMQTLNARERRVIKERRLSDNPTTLEALGVEFGISKERVRQIETKALEKMAAAMHAHREEALATL